MTPLIAFVACAVLSACSLGPSLNTAVERSITVDGRARTFLVTAPPPGTGLRPLVIAYHGLGGNGADMERGTGFNDLAAQLGFVVFYPNGVRGEWAMDCAGCTNVDTMGVRDLVFTDSLIALAVRDYKVDPHRVYATGFSLGSYFTHVLACKRPASFAAVAPVGGHMTTLMSDACPSGVPIPILAVSGMADDAMPYNGRVNQKFTIFSADSTAAFWAARNGCNATPAADSSASLAGPLRSTVHVRSYAQCTGGAEVTRWGIEGLPHVWPGVGSYGSRDILLKLFTFTR
jgi:polyhydroxybutyrate depolymerase